jgi:hypothetical protein
VVSAAFSPDGTRVVTASYDRATWGVHGPVVSATFSIDGTRVVTASWDHTTRVWDVRPDTGALADWVRVAERSPFVSMPRACSCADRHWARRHLRTEERRRRSGGFRTR